MIEVLYNRYIDNILDKLGMDQQDITKELLAIYRNKAIKHFNDLLTIIRHPYNYSDAYLIIDKDQDNIFCLKADSDQILEKIFTIKATNKKEQELINTLREIAPLINKMLSLNIKPYNITQCLYMVNGQYQIQDLNSDVIKSLCN